MEDFFLPLHLLSLLFVAWNVFHADHMGFDWIRGKVSVLNESVVKKYHTRTWIGLGLMIITGFILFWPMHEYLLGRTQFSIKMAFVVTLICNGFVINHLMKRATTHTFKELSFSEKLPLFISGAVSTIAWLGAAITAFFINEF